MARCGCSGGACSCVIVSGDGVVVTGTGSAGDPYVVTAVPLVFEPGDGITITGTGTLGDPYVISAV